jgi:gluconate 2-dehydrogenase gamma chain
LSEDNDEKRDLLSATLSARLSRRRLLHGAGIAALGAYGLAGCGGESNGTPVAEDIDASQYPPVPPSAPPMFCNVHQFFDAKEAEAVEAISARLIPGTPEDPGARQACVTTYIDSKLARFPAFAEPTYFDAPFADSAKRNMGPQVGAKKTIYVLEDDLARYGFQGDLRPQEAYRNGLKSLDAYTREKFGGRFAGLSEADQDKVLGKLEKDRAKRWFTDPGGADFFQMVLDDTIEGMFSDPVYGGNRDMVGWKLIGYPGAQRNYTPEEMRHGTKKAPQSLMMMPASHGGDPNDDPHAILPMSGSEGQR